MSLFLLLLLFSLFLDIVLVFANVIVRVIVLVTGLVLVVAIPALLGGQTFTGRLWLDRAMLVIVIGVALWPAFLTPGIAAMLLGGAFFVGRNMRRAAMEGGQ